MARVHVLGLGNIYQGDDGFGPRVCEALREAPLPDDVRVFDVGTSGLHALNLLEDCAHAVFVDAMNALGEPGRLHRLLPGDARIPGDPLSMHGLGLAYLLRVMPIALSSPPSVVMICAEVQDLRGFSASLSPPVQRAIPQAVALVSAEVQPR